MMGEILLIQDGKNLRQVRRTNWDGRHFTAFAATFNNEPSGLDIEHAQREAGYAPEGYGMPWKMKKSLLSTGVWIATWECAGSCD